MSYDALRHFADSYGLAAMTLIYLALVGWIFLPGASSRGRRAAESIFEDDDHGR